jgi:hypothetical protein
MSGGGELTFVEFSFSMIFPIEIWGVVTAFV